MYITDYSIQSGSGWGRKLNEVSVLNKINKLQHHPLILGIDGGDLLCVMCEHLPVTMDFSERLTKMLEFTLEEVLENVGEKGKYDFVFGLPEKQTGKPESIIIGLENVLEKKMTKNINRYFRLAGCKHLGYKLLEETYKMINSGDTENVIIVSIDSCHNEDYISYLKREKKVFSEKTSEGVIPGEASIALIVSNKGNRRGQKIVFMMQSKSLKEILTELFHDFPEMIIGHVTGNLETRKVINEYSLSVMKFSSHFREMGMYNTPSGYFGDTGAVEILVMLFMDNIFRIRDKNLASMILEWDEDLWSVIVLDGNL